MLETSRNGILWDAMDTRPYYASIVDNNTNRQTPVLVRQQVMRHHVLLMVYRGNKPQWSIVGCDGYQTRSCIYCWQQYQSTDTSTRPSLNTRHNGHRWIACTIYFRGKNVSQNAPKNIGWPLAVDGHSTKSAVPVLDNICRQCGQFIVGDSG